ncbi:MAG: hypothetical protein VX563_01745, partial [Planctomycetota bacterium]|nr:hypothetical protein [Planctomycetota bacterium]
MQSELRQTSEYDEFLKAARLRLMASQGACSSRHAGLLAASIEGLMAERAVSWKPESGTELFVSSASGSSGVHWLIYLLIVCLLLSHVDGAMISGNVCAVVASA